MKEPLFTGAATALVTPFLGDSINYPMLEQLLRRQIDAGIEAVVIAGTGSNSTRHTMELSMAAEQTGVDGLLLVSPYYNKATPEGLYAHYLAVAHSVSLPVILYNVPTRTGVDIPVSVYRRLSRIPNIAGAKESAPDITKYTKILAQCGSSMAIWAGNDDMATPVIALGGKGVISVLSNILPTETQALARAALDGDFDTAAALQIQLQPLVEALFAEVNPIPVKQAMQFIGYDCGGCRLPLTPLSDENREKLRALLLR